MRTTFPGFTADASLYPTTIHYFLAGAFAVADVLESGPVGGLVSAQWDFCTPCERSCVKTCCTYTQIGLVCAQRPCCVPAWGPCTVSTVFWPHRGVRTFTDACCNATAYPCDFCLFDRKNPDPQKCINDCVSRSCAGNPDMQDCLGKCNCCCASATAGTVCEDCLGGIWKPNPTGIGGHCTAE